jgi:hypothetical protein
MSWYCPDMRIGVDLFLVVGLGMTRIILTIARMKLMTTNFSTRSGDDTKESGIMVNTENLGGRPIISKLMDGNIATCR